MPWHRQASVLARFGEGDVNLLLATSVCEEGMDILRLDHRDVALVQIEANDEVAGLAAADSMSVLHATALWCLRSFCAL
jgi:RecG-like helicase